MKAPCGPEHMAGPRGRLRWFGRGAVAAVAWAVLAALVGLGWFLWRQWQSPLVIGRSLEEARPLLLLWRLTFFGALIGFWPVWVRLVTRWRRLTDDQGKRLSGARWKIAMWFLVLELVLGQNVVGRCLNLLANGTG
jgi:hypothetical protein